MISKNSITKVDLSQWPEFGLFVVTVGIPRLVRFDTVMIAQVNIMSNV